MKNQTKIFFFFIAILSFIAFGHNESIAGSINIEIDSINETRSENDFFARTEVTLNIYGDDIANYRGILPIKITKSYTDRKTILKKKSYNPSENLFSFAKIQQNNKSSQRISLTNPARQDRKLFIEGEISLYKPQDSSVIELQDYNQLSLTRINNNILEQNGIDILFFTKYEFQDFITKSEKIINKAKLKNINVHDSLVEQFGSEITYIIENYRRIYNGEYFDIYFVISGNWQKVVNIEFFSKTGIRIHSPCGSIAHGPNKIISLIDFDNKLPSNGNIKVEIIQDGDITIFPFSLSADLP